MRTLAGQKLPILVSSCATRRRRTDEQLNENTLCLTAR